MKRYNEPMNTVLIKMTEAYSHQSFYQKIENLSIIDCRDLEGTRCYCDDIARNAITEKLSSFPPEGVHFIDSGNYHYLSLLWLEKIDYDFSLVLFDHHPDDQPPSFGDILSCGGWVLEAKEKLPHLKEVYTFGVGKEIPPEEIPADYPLFISIDKDALSTDFALTDWDQGAMTLDQLLGYLSTLFKGHKIIGADICGDASENSENAAAKNNQTNTILFDFLSSNF